MPDLRPGLGISPSVVGSCRMIVMAMTVSIVDEEDPADLLLVILLRASGCVLARFCSVRSAESGRQPAIKT